MILFQLTHPSLPQLLQLGGAADALLLRQDAVYLLLSELVWPGQIYVSAIDAAFRQVQLPSQVIAIDDQEWVDLSLQANQVLLCPAF